MQSLASSTIDPNTAASTTTVSSASIATLQRGGTRFQATADKLWFRIATLRILFVFFEFGILKFGIRRSVAVHAPDT